MAKKIFLSIIALCFLLVGLFVFGVKKIGPDQNNYQLPITNDQTVPHQLLNNSRPQINSPNLPEISPTPEISAVGGSPPKADAPLEHASGGKTQINLAVPFTPQAPFAAWDDLHNEACEEASLLIVHYYLTGKSFTPEIADQEILKMVDWQKKNWGGHYDLNLENLAKLAQEYFDYQKIKILTDPSFEEIKKELSDGNPLIVPMAGRLLKNPYYRQPGPYYHMLVVRGYQGEEIITNDPGTRRGQNFRYPKEKFFEAIHDWPGPLGSTKDDVDILKGRKAVLIIDI